MDRETRTVQRTAARLARLMEREPTPEIRERRIGLRRRLRLLASLYGREFVVRTASPRLGTLAPWHTNPNWCTGEADQAERPTLTETTRAILEEAAQLAEQTEPLVDAVSAIVEDLKDKRLTPDEALSGIGGLLSAIRDALD